MISGSRSTTSLTSDRNTPSPNFAKTVNVKKNKNYLSSQPQGSSEAHLNLNKLDISNANIDDETIKRVCDCNRVTCINAKNNNINFASVSVFSNLISLDLSLNELRNLHVPPGSFSKIQKLDLSYNFLPPAALVDLANLQCLRSLFLSGNELSSVPTKLRFSTLEELNLDDNKLHAAADIAALAQLPNLRRLSLANNEFTSFPILRVKAKLSPSKSKKPTAAKNQVFDDIVTLKDVERFITSYSPKHQPSNCSRQSTLQKTNLRQISPYRNPLKPSMKTPIKTNSLNPPLIFPKLMHLDMAENMLNFEEAIIPVVVCPNLKVLSLCGNPFIEEFPKAPPKIQTILVEQHGISVECERSKFWCSKYSRLGSTKLGCQRRDHLPPLTTVVKNVDEEFEEKSTVDVSEVPDSSEHPLFSQHELSIEYSELPIGIQKCLKEFKSLEIDLKESEISEREEDNDPSTIAGSNLEPEWIRCAELSTTDLPQCKTQEKSSGAWRNSGFQKEEDNFGSPAQTKRSGRRRRSQRAVRHSFFKSNGADGLQRPKISSLYRMLQEAIENPRDSIE
ncbi:X ray radiation resistance associated protein 1 [Echinococcus multilocularis]|uniref:X ray radiation resistance associated protein 1 n=1 Tax=Echinococcus multilocularis TaxID=6211 RepID=A0A068XWI5_ECHMU|nr:X ray radiation resistance associated protein 1 [Echinococcus multilocularis]